ncbi:MAG: class I tRNA ligase family protein, partial [Candidatus Woesebacteria bacterium]|nr:class I tRNA ligase family protein [Candidatus Woesebacteria bacterium]
EYVEKFGADALRIYLAFMGPMDSSPDFRDSGMEGASRFLGKVWRLFNEESEHLTSPRLRGVDNTAISSKLHQTIKKVTKDIEGYKFNTAISGLMELVNVMNEYKVSSTKYLETLALLLAPFAPHLSEEVWVEILGKPFSIHKANWPKYDDSLIRSDTVEIVVQVNGKMRGTLSLESGIGNRESEVTQLAKDDEKIAKWLEGKKIIKIIFVPGKIINFVIS